MTLPASVAGLTRRFGDDVAVEDVTFEVRPGRIVGLLGRNGAGKTTTLRMLLGLTAPTSGSALVFGKPFADLEGSAWRIGVGLDGIGAVPDTTVGRDLEIWARMLGVPRSWCAEVVEMVGLPDAVDRKVTDLSTGMRQRHGLALALLGDPELLVLDEPATGLDPDGIRWLRGLLRALAAEGRSVLLSSHLLSEVEQTVDDVVIIQRTVRYVGSLDDLTDQGSARLEDRFFEVVGNQPAGR